MSARHVHRFEMVEQRKVGLAGVFGRTRLVIACPCGVTSTEHLEQLRGELDVAESRVHELHCGDETCTDDHG